MNVYRVGATNERDGSPMDPNAFASPLQIPNLPSVEHACLLDLDPFVDLEDDIDFLVRDQLSDVSARGVSPDVWDNIVELLVGDFYLKFREQSAEQKDRMVASWSVRKLELGVGALDILLESSPAWRGKGEIHVRMEHLTEEEDVEDVVRDLLPHPPAGADVFLYYSSEEYVHSVEDETTESTAEPDYFWVLSTSSLFVFVPFAYV